MAPSEADEDGADEAADEVAEDEEDEEETEVICADGARAPAVSSIAGKSSHPLATPSVRGT